MRLLILAACVVALAACNNDRAATEATSESTTVPETLSGNDITAIDAATSDSANMAADVEITGEDANLSNETGDNGAEGNSANNSASR